MTLTVWACADPCLAFERKADSSGAMREKRPVAVGVLERCPKAMPVAKTTTMKVLRRLPQAALCRSSRPAGLVFVVVTIEISPFLQGAGENTRATVRCWC